jgi:hypothetical protein
LPLGLDPGSNFLMPIWLWDHGVLTSGSGPHLYTALNLRLCNYYEFMCFTWCEAPYSPSPPPSSCPLPPLPWPLQSCHHLRRQLRVATGRPAEDLLPLSLLRPVMHSFCYLYLTRTSLFLASLQVIVSRKFAILSLAFAAEHHFVENST